MPQKPIHVLIVDNSALIRQMLTQMLSGDADIEVVGSASDPYVARDKIKHLLPDIITLDIEMPRMDGLEFLHKIMTLRPMPVVMVSSLTQAGANTILQALEMGAIDFVAKPTVDLQVGLAEKQDEIRAEVKAAASANLRREAVRASVQPRASGYSSKEKIVAIGASTGGVEALRTVLAALPANSPAILNHPAHAGPLNLDLRQTPRRFVQHRSGGSLGRHARPARTCLYRPQRLPPAPGPERRQLRVQDGRR